MRKAAKAKVAPKRCRVPQIAVRREKIEDETCKAEVQRTTAAKDIRQDTSLTSRAGMSS